MHVEKKERNNREIESEWKRERENGGWKKCLTISASNHINCVLVERKSFLFAMINGPSNWVIWNYELRWCAPFQSGWYWRIYASPMCNASKSWAFVCSNKIHSVDAVTECMFMIVFACRWWNKSQPIWDHICTHRSKHIYAYRDYWYFV